MSRRVMPTRRIRQGPEVPELLLDLAAGREPASAEVDKDTIRLANDHRLTGLLWTWARENVDDPALRQEMAQNDLFVQAHLVDVWRVLEECVERLADAGIEVATLKGVTAEHRWYGRRGERPCSDVDLLLSPHQLDRAGDAVRILEPGHPWEGEVADLATSGGIQVVTTQFDGLEVDLHFDLLKLGISTRQSRSVWDLTEPFPLPNGTSVPVLDDTTALVHFLVHLNKDRFQRLLGYADVARIVDSGQVDWAQAEAFARVEGIEVAVFRSLEVVLDRLSLPRPRGVLPTEGARARFWNLVWRPSIRLRGTEGRLLYRRREDWIPITARGRTLEAIRWWLRRMWPPKPLVETRYADVRGPYIWKLFRGRLQTMRAKRAGAIEDRTAGKREAS